MPDPSVNPTHRKLSDHHSDPLIIHCYFCCGSLVFLNKDRSSPAEWNMVSITTLFNDLTIIMVAIRHIWNQHILGSMRHLEAAQRSHTSCQMNARILLWYFSLRSKVKKSHLSNNTYTDLRWTCEVLFCCEWRRSLSCLLANEMGSSVPHEATSGVWWTAKTLIESGQRSRFTFTNTYVT